MNQELSKIRADNLARVEGFDNRTPVKIAGQSEKKLVSPLRSPHIPT